MRYRPDWLDQLGEFMHEPWTGLMAKAVRGDAKTATLLTNLAQKLLDTGATDPLFEELGDDDLAILDAYEHRIQSGPVAKSAAAPSHANPPSDREAGGDE